MRQNKRLALDEPARLHPNSWSSVEARVLECSESGFRAACDVAIRVGFIVTLEIPGVGPAKAHVSWRQGDQFHAKFIEPVDLTRAAFRPLGKEAVLARLLIERAAAHSAGSSEQEKQLRLQILESLPLRRVGNT